MTDAKCCPIAIKTTTIASWKISIIPALIRLAFLIPKTTGSDSSPRLLSPSTLLKSFITAIPKPDKL